MKYFNLFFFFSFLIFISPCLFAQSYFDGYVYKKTDSTAVSGANILINGSKGAESNEKGYFKIPISSKDTVVTISYIGYNEISEKISGLKKKKNEYFLEVKVFENKEITVTANKAEENVNNVRSGQIFISAKEMKLLPQMVGETDVLKMLTLMPGVQNLSEGQSGIIVRGGNYDQNLILLDDVVIYNPAHLFGFLSTFNVDFLSNVKLIKSNMPAEYGGRLSSVVDIETKGITDKFSATANLSPIAPSFTFELPVVADKISIVASARKTYIDQIIRLLENKIDKIKTGTAYSFYDINAKINAKIYSKLAMELNFYKGNDYFKYLGKSDFKSENSWGNIALSCKLNQKISAKAHFKLIAGYSKYNNSFDINQNIYSVKMSSAIESYTFKASFNYLLKDKNFVKIGTEINKNSFSPSDNRASTDTTDFYIGARDIYYTFEKSFYVQNEYELTKRISIISGIRFSLFSHTGPFNRLVKDNNDEIIDTLFFKKNEKIKSYFAVEPRVGARYLLNKNSSLKFSITRNAQFQHLISMSTIALPTDVWLTSTDVIKPQYGTQFSVGYFRNLKNSEYEVYTDLFYKTMKNLLEYKEDVMQFYEQSNFDMMMYSGRGYVYGTEIYIKKNSGKWNGWFSYTFSRSMRIVDQINDGKAFPSKFDKTHNLALVSNYILNSKLQFTAGFYYQTGAAITIPVARYIIQNNIINIYSSKNGFRMPAYHRLDIGLLYMIKSTRKMEAVLNFSIYNVYSRKNPYYIFYDIKGNINQYKMEIKAKQISLFPIIPSVSMNIKFY